MVLNGVVDAAVNGGIANYKVSVDFLHNVPALIYLFTVVMSVMRLRILLTCNAMLLYLLSLLLKLELLSIDHMSSQCATLV